MWRIICALILVVVAIGWALDSLGAVEAGRPTIAALYGVGAFASIIVAFVLAWRCIAWIDARTYSRATAANPKRVRSALSAAGIPEHMQDKFVEFQQKYAGKEGNYGGNAVVWGILLDKTQSPGSAMTPGGIEAFCEDGVWQVVCADIHASDTLTIDQFGRLYWCYSPRYTTFDRFIQGLPPDLTATEK